MRGVPGDAELLRFVVVQQPAQARVEGIQFFRRVHGAEEEFPGQVLPVGSESSGRNILEAGDTLPPSYLHHVGRETGCTVFGLPLRRACNTPWA